MRAFSISNCQEIRRFEHDESIVIHAQFSASGHRVAVWGYSEKQSRHTVSLEGSIFETMSGKFLDGYDPTLSCELEFSAYNFGRPPDLEGDIVSCPTNGELFSFKGTANFPSSNREVAVIDARKSNQKSGDNHPTHYLLNCKLWQDYQTNDDDSLSSEAIKSIDFLPDELNVIDISEDSQRLLASQPWKNGWNNIISVWDIKSGRRIASLKPEIHIANSGHKNTIKSATFIAGQHDKVLTISYSTTWGAATGTDDVAGIIWNAVKGVAKVPLFCWQKNRDWDTENIHNYAVLNGGRWIALIRGDAETHEPNDRFIKVFDTKTGLEIAVFEHPTIDEVPDNYVTSIAADVNATYLISTSEHESFARVWNVEEKRQVARCDVKGTEVVDVDMKSIDGHLVLLTAHYKAMAILWCLPNS